jgi:hypothetical protein
MERMRVRWAGLVASLVLSGAIAGCTSSGSGEGAGSTLQNFLLYGGATVPSAMPTPPIDVDDCPAVTVTEGGAAVRSGTSQLAIAHVARECIGRPDGSIAVRVGVQVRGLLGSGSGGARFDAPVTFTLLRGDRVLVSRARRVSMGLSGSQLEQTAVVVEDNLVVPAGTGEFDIEVGLGARSRSAAPRSSRRTPG